MLKQKISKLSLNMKYILTHNFNLLFSINQLYLKSICNKL